MPERLMYARFRVAEIFVKTQSGLSQVVAANLPLCLVKRVVDLPFLVNWTLHSSDEAATETALGADPEHLWPKLLQ